jgi:hypothetical protein
LKINHLMDEFHMDDFAARVDTSSSSQLHYAAPTELWFFWVVTTNMPLLRSLRPQLTVQFRAANGMTPFLSLLTPAATGGALGRS